MARARSADREAREARERLRRYTARQAVHDKQVTRRRCDNLYAVGGVIVVVALATVTQLFYFNGGPGTPTPTPSATAETPRRRERRRCAGCLGLPSSAPGRAPSISARSPWISNSTAPQHRRPLRPSSTSAATGYYDGTSLPPPRLSESAGLLQCGSLDGTGASDPSYSFGPVENAPIDDVYPAGTIAMARVADDAYSIGRQFFIVFQDTHPAG